MRYLDASLVAGCRWGFGWGTAVYDTFETWSWGATEKIVIILPDEAPRPHLSNPVKLIFLPNGGTSRSEITTLRCDEGNVTGVGGTHGTISLPELQSCALTASSSFGTYTATLTHTSQGYALSEGTYVHDNVAPTISISGVPNTANAPFTATFTFSESVTGFAVGDITVGNGSASNFVADDGNTYTADITPNGNSDITIDVAAGVAQDAAGNDNTAAPQIVSVFVSSVLSASIGNIELHIDGKCNSSEPTLFKPFHTVTGATFDDSGDRIMYLIVDNTGKALESASSFSVAVGTPTTRFTIVGTRADPNPGYFTFFVLDEGAPIARGDIVSVSGTTLSANSNDYPIAAMKTFDPSLLDPDCAADNTAPMLVIQNAPASVTNTNAFSVTFEFSENVTGFALGDITVGNGVASNLVAVDGNTFTADITPSGAGSITIDVAAGTAQDGAGNSNVIAPQVSTAFDNTAPTVSLPNAPTAVSDTTPFEVTWEFSEDVTGFDVGDITVGNGSVSNFVAVDSNTYRILITPNGNGNISINVAAGAVQDFAGNNSPAMEVHVALDETAPTVAVQNAPASVISMAVFTVTLEFSEDVSDFSLEDITVVNGTSTNFNTVDGNTYTADISPSGAGDITIDVAAGVAQDGAGNDNEAAPQVTVTYIGQGTIKIIKVTSPALAGNDRFEYSSTDADLDAISLTTVRNTATSATFTKTAGSYTLTEGTLKSWRLDAIACTGDDDGGSVIDVSARKVTIDLDGAEAIVCTFTSVREEDYVRTRTKRVIGNFMARRADQITANEPDLVGRLSKQGDGSSGSPVSFTGNGNEFSNSFTFSTSLRQLVGSSEQAKEKQRRILGSMMSLGQQSLVSQYGSGLLPGFDIWVQGKWAHSTSDTRGTDLGLLYTGVEYQLSPSLLVGVIGQIDWSDETDKTEDIAVDGKGWMVGPYLVAKLHDNLLFDGRVAWGRSSNHVNPMGLYSDGFDASRWLVRGQLTGDFAYDNWRFSPHVRVIYFEEEQKAYIDSLGIDIPGQTISLGRMTFGPKISYGFKTDDGLSIAPHIGIKGIWDFQRADIVDLDTGAITNSDESWRARVEGGVTASFTNGWSLNGQGFYDGIGSDSLEAYGGSVKLSIPMN